MGIAEKILGYGLGAASLYGALKPDSGIGKFLGMGGQQAPVGYTGGIPDYTFSRAPLANAFSQTAGTDPTTGMPIPRRPGSMGRNYFTTPTFTPTGKVLGPANAPATPEFDEDLMNTIVNLIGSGSPGADTTSAGGEDYTEGLATDASTQAAVNEALAGDTTLTGGGADTTLTGGGADTTLTGGGDDTTDFFYGADGTQYENKPGYKNTTVASYLIDGTLSDSEAASIAGLLESSTDEGKAAIMSTFDAFDPSFGTQFQGYLDSLANDQMGETTYVRNQNPDGTYSYRSFQGMGLVEGDEIITKDQYDAFMASQNTNTGGDTNTNTGGDTTTTSETEFNNFISNYFNKDLSEEDLVALDNSGYSAEKLAEAFSVGLETPISTEQLQNAMNKATGLDQFGVKTAQSADALGSILDAIPGKTVDFDADTAVDAAAAAIGVTEAELVASLLERGAVTIDDVSEAYGISKDEIRKVYAQMGGTKQLAQGGIAQGYYLGGPTDGMADLIPATIDGTQPAALSDGEFVIPADVVSHLGNGNSEAGAEQLYSMMDRVRDERTGTTKQGPEIDPMQMMPA